MKRYIAQFVRGGFPELYAVADTAERCLIGDPKPYHEANDEAEARNNGTWPPMAEVFLTAEQYQSLATWCAGMNIPSQP